MYFNLNWKVGCKKANHYGVCKQSDKFKYCQAKTSIRQMERAIKVQKRVFFIEVVTFPKRNVFQFGKCIFLFFPGGETCGLIFKTTTCHYFS